MSSPSSAPSRCRHCGARLGAEDAWCSLCLTPTAEPAPEVVKAEEEPRHRAEAPDTDRLIEDLAADEAGDRSALAVVRAHLALAELPGGKYTLALGGGVVLLLVLLAGLTLLGLLL